MHVSYLLMLMELCVNSACEISASVAFLARKAAAFSQHTADCKCLKSVAFCMLFPVLPPFALRNIVSGLFVGSIYKASIYFVFYRNQ